MPNYKIVVMDLFTPFRTDFEGKNISRFLRACALTLLISMHASPARAAGWLINEMEAVLAFRTSAGGVEGIAIGYRPAVGCKALARYFLIKSGGNIGREIETYKSSFSNSEMIWNIDGTVYSDKTMAVRYDNGYEVAFIAPAKMLSQLDGAKRIRISGLRRGTFVIDNSTGFLTASAGANRRCRQG